MKTTNTDAEKREALTNVIYERHRYDGEEPASYAELIADLQLRVEAIEDFLSVQ